MSRTLVLRCRGGQKLMRKNTAEASVSLRPLFAPGPRTGSGATFARMIPLKEKFENERFNQGRALPFVE